MRYYSFKFSVYSKTLSNKLHRRRNKCSLLNNSQKIITVYIRISRHPRHTKMTKIDALYSYCEFYDQERMDYAHLYVSNCFSPLSRFLKYLLTAYWDGDLVLWRSHLN